MLKIGLLGASRIAVPAIIEPARKFDDIDVTEVAARDPNRARDFAAIHGIGGVQADYAALINSPNVDLIYNGLPPHQHAPLTIAALAAGKHVLCEKPFAMDAAEALAMAKAATKYDRRLMEAFHYRFHPLFTRLMDMLASERIGQIEAVAAHFGVPIPYSESEFRYRPDMGGGALMDLGCYAVHWARTVVGAEPKVVRARRQLHASGVDIETSATLEFATGEMARISCAMNEDLADTDGRLSIVGRGGRIDVQNPGAPHNGNRITLTNSEGLESEEVAGETSFFYQLQHIKALIDGRVAPILPPQDAVSNMQVIDAIVALSAE